MAAHAEATFWFVLPSLPMFMLIPLMLRHGFGFWASLLRVAPSQSAFTASWCGLGRV